jgi:c-di-GMP-binding flagellar brake protein YcgR
MNELQLFKPNLNIDIVIGKKGHKETYKSRIEEITPSGLVLAMPMRKGYPIILPSGEVFQGKFITDETAYLFDSQYIAKRQTPLPVWITSLPYNITKIQQRNFVRLDTAVSVTLKVVHETTNDQPPTVADLKTLTKDISGGGALIVTKTPFDLGTKVEVSLDIPEGGIVSTTGEVIRVEQPATDQKVYRIAVKFTDITEKQRNQIIKYIFRIQLERRRKGL